MHSNNPDKSKLNYHAEVSIHHLGKFALFMEKYIGVQFPEELELGDVLIASLLHHACSYPSIDLSIVWFSEKESRLTVVNREAKEEGAANGIRRTRDSHA